MYCDLDSLCMETASLRSDLEDLVTRFEDFTFDFDEYEDMANVYDFIEDINDIEFAM